MTLPINQVLCGDCLDVMAPWPENCIDLVLFSPPYYGLRDYGEGAVAVWGGDPTCEHDFSMEIQHHDALRYRGENSCVGSERNPEIRKTPKIEHGFCVKCSAWRGQLGLEPSWQLYITHMTLICHELKRVLKKSGSMYIVMGDTYAGSGCGAHHYRDETATGILRKRQRELYQNKPVPQLKPYGYQPKCLMGIPWRLAFSLIADGWILRNAITWHKPNAMPSSVKDRLTNAYELVFHFVQARKYYYDLDAIRVAPVSYELRRRLRERKQGLVTRFQNQKMDDLANPPSQKSGLRTNVKTDTYLFQGKNPGDTIKIPTDLQGNKIIGKGLPAPKPFNCDRCGKETQDYFYTPDWGDVVPKEWRKSELCFDCYKEVRGDIFQTKKEPYVGNNPHRMRLEADRYKPFDPSKPMDLSHPQGKNPSDFWSINTVPFPQAHFAVYPLALCKRPILSSCPSQICKKCGKPRTRITKRIKLKPRIINGEESGLQYSSGEQGFVQKGTRMGDSLHETVGWSDCRCGEAFDAGIVLDPMCGSGTTLVAAQKLGRRWIGIDISENYVEMAKKRLMRECSQKLVKWT